MVKFEWTDKVLSAINSSTEWSDDVRERVSQILRDFRVAQNSTSTNKRQIDAIALLREWVDDPGGKVCNDLYERSVAFLSQQH